MSMRGALSIAGVTDVWRATVLTLRDESRGCVLSREGPNVEITRAHSILRRVHTNGNNANTRYMPV